MPNSNIRGLFQSIHDICMNTFGIIKLTLISIYILCQCLRLLIHYISHNTHTHTHTFGLIRFRNDFRGDNLHIVHIHNTIAAIDMRICDDMFRGAITICGVH